MSNVGDAQSTTKNLHKIKNFLYNPTPYVNDLFGHEVHLFMHCHMKGKVQFYKNNLLWNDLNYEDFKNTIRKFP